MDLVNLENNLITKRLTIKTTEVDILDTQAWSIGVQVFGSDSIHQL